jgi:hypothetical protein
MSVVYPIESKAETGGLPFRVDGISYEDARSDEMENIVLVNERRLLDLAWRTIGGAL